MLGMGAYCKTVTATLIGSQAILKNLYHPDYLSAGKLWTDLHFGVLDMRLDNVINYMQWSTLNGQLNLAKRKYGFVPALTKWLEVFKEVHNIPDWEHPFLRILRKEKL